jgi:hypothetical protein
VCVVPHVIGRAISATPARSPRRPPSAAEGVDRIGAVASTVGIPIEDAPEPVVSEPTFVDE